MQKFYCDACNNEIDKPAHVQRLSIPVHLLTSTVSGYVRNVGDQLVPCSGRDVGLELCLPCFNSIMGEAVKYLHSLQEAANLPATRFP